MAEVGVPDPGLRPSGHRVVGLEDHAATEHPGWVARFEVVRPYPNQHLRVVYRQVEWPLAT